MEQVSGVRRRGLRLAQQSLHLEGHSGEQVKRPIVEVPAQAKPLFGEGRRREAAGQPQCPQAIGQRVRNDFAENQVVRSHPHLVEEEQAPRHLFSRYRDGERRTGCENRSSTLGRGARLSSAGTRRGIRRGNPRTPRRENRHARVQRPRAGGMRQTVRASADTRPDPRAQARARAPSLPPASSMRGAVIPAAHLSIEPTSSSVFMASTSGGVASCCIWRRTRASSAPSRPVSQLLPPAPGSGRRCPRTEETRIHEGAVETDHDGHDQQQQRRSTASPAIAIEGFRTGMRTRAGARRGTWDDRRRPGVLTPPGGPRRG